MRENVSVESKESPYNRGWEHSILLLHNLKNLDRLTYRNGDKAYLFYGMDAEWSKFSRYEVLDNAIQKLAMYEDMEQLIATKRGRLAMEDWSRKEPKFRYMLLDRLRQNCDYYLRIGGSANCLWADSEKEQIQTMIDIWNSFPDDDKPEWLTMEQIKEFAQKMGVDN